nr:MAG TPA: hypothetical protein [Caudoviricetes sp.]
MHPLRKIMERQYPAAHTPERLHMPSLCREGQAGKGGDY